MTPKHKNVTLLKLEWVTTEHYLIGLEEPTAAKISQKLHTVLESVNKKA